MLTVLMMLLASAPASAEDGTALTRLSMQDLRALARDLKNRDRSFIHTEAGLRAEAARLHLEAEDVHSAFRRDCMSGAGRSLDAALEVRCQNLEETHLVLRVEDLRLQARAWSREADHLADTQGDVERLAMGALPAPGEGVNSDLQDSSATPIGGGAGIVLLGGAKGTRLAGRYLRDIEAISGKIDAKVQQAAKSAGVKQPQHMAVALAARAAKGKVMERELRRGAGELSRIADMLELGATLEPDGLEVIDLGEMISPLNGDPNANTGFGSEDELPPAEEVTAETRRF